MNVLLLPRSFKWRGSSTEIATVRMIAFITTINHYKIIQFHSYQDWRRLVFDSDTLELWHADRKNVFIHVTKYIYVSWRWEKSG